MTRPLDLSVKLSIPELESVGLKADRASLTKGVLVLGGTGSGKSASILIPILTAVLRERLMATESERSAVIVLDPKRELAPRVLALCDTVHLVGSGMTPPLDPFGSLDRRGADPGVFTDRLLAIAGDGGELLRDPFWRVSGRELIRDCVALDLAFLNVGGGVADAHVRRALVWRELSQACLSAGRLSASEARELGATQRPISRYLTLLRLLAREPGQGSAQRSGAEIVREIISTHLPDVVLPGLFRLPELASETSTSMVATAASLLGALSSARVQEAVRLDVIPAVRRLQRLNLRDCISLGEVVVYQPADASLESTAIARAVKSAVYDAVLSGAACGPDNRPQRLAVLVADEAQAILTTTGVRDQSYLEQCRASGGATILASQSLSAMRDCLPDRSTDAVRAITTNMSTLVQLRTTCPETARELGSLVVPPPIPGPHLFAVRPPSLYRTGEVLWISEGSWGTGRVRLQREEPIGGAIREERTTRGDPAQRDDDLARLSPGL